jgi:hypothetical protein
MDLKNFYRISHPTAAEYMFFLAACGTIHHILGHKTSFSKYNKVKISYILSDGIN